MRLESDRCFPPHIECRIRPLNIHRSCDLSIGQSSIIRQANINNATRYHVLPTRPLSSHPHNLRQSSTNPLFHPAAFSSVSLSFSLRYISPWLTSNYPRSHKNPIPSHKPITCCPNPFSPLTLSYRIIPRPSPFILTSKAHACKGYGPLPSLVNMTINI